MRNSLQRWITSKYALGWQLALALFLNYPVTGFFFGETSTASTGFTNHFVNLVTGLSCSFVILIFAQIRAMLKLESILFVQIAFFISTTVSIFVSNLVNVEIGFVQEDALVLVSGFAQMFMVHNLYAFVISSLMETRNDRKILEFKLDRLRSVQVNFENQIQEINARLTTIVNEKLSLILTKLQEAFSSDSDADPKFLAKQISDSLNEGVRPLSWNIETENSSINTEINLQNKRISLLERLNFLIQVKQVFTTRLLILFFVFFDIPVMYFYFGFAAAIQTAIAIFITAVALWVLKSLFGTRKIPSWLATTLIAATVALASSTFIVYRQLTGELTAEVAETALVFSMIQIAIITSIFQSSLVRRVAYIESQRLVNAELEQLVSRLRQSAWVAKKKLGRLVHGQVQSELFASYLQLSQATKPDPLVYKEVSDRIEKAKGALTQPDLAVQDFETVLEQIIATWGSSFKVHTHIASPAQAALQKDPVASACAIEVIREGVNNAAKYGTSGSASLAIELRDDSRLYIEVINEAESSDEMIAGYGSEILDDVTHEWNLEITNGVARLTAEIMLSKN